MKTDQDIEIEKPIVRVYDREGRSIPVLDLGPIAHAQSPGPPPTLNVTDGSTPQTEIWNKHDQTLTVDGVPRANIDPATLVANEITAINDGAIRFFSCGAAYGKYAD